MIKWRHKKNRRTSEEVRIGKLHHIGQRSSQQDCLGITETSDGIFAVVADGMGGLTDGDKVSQSVVMTMLTNAVEDSSLPEMLARANSEVNRMLGEEGLYKSGSTVVAVKVSKEKFQWISVGDSRIYLYRNHSLIQLNREHTYETELMKKVVNGELLMKDVEKDLQRHRLTSFIGMGQLKYVDFSHKPIAIQENDWVLLMSDGVFNTLTDDEITSVLRQCAEPQAAALAMENLILSYERKQQDNFTAIILQF